MGGPSSSTSQTNTPWKPLEEPLKDVISEAGGLHSAGIGEQVYPGTTVAPFSVPTQTGIGQGFEMALRGSPVGDQFQDYMSSSIDRGGVNPLMSEAVGYMRPTAGGGMRENPFFERALDYQSDKIADKVNSYFGDKGRVGSGAHGGTMAKELAGMRFGALADQFNTERGREMSAIDNMARLGQAGESNVQGWGSIAPSMDALRFADVDRMLKSGAMIEGKQKEVMTEAADKFAQQNMLPWTHLSQLQEILNPPMVNFGKRSGTAKENFNPMSLLGIPMMAMGK